MPVKHFILHFKTEETCFAVLLLLFIFLQFHFESQMRHETTLFSEDIQVDQHQPSTYIISPNHRWWLGEKQLRLPFNTSKQTTTTTSSGRRWHLVTRHLSAKPILQKVMINDFFSGFNLSIKIRHSSSLISPLMIYFEKIASQFPNNFDCFHFLSFWGLFDNLNHFSKAIYLP